MELVVMIYKLTKDFPREEIYGITSQIRRAAVSIPSNIAEGSQRGSDRDFDYFLRISKGSSAELETQLLIANRLNYIKDHKLSTKILDLLIEVRKMTSGLRIALRKDSKLQAPGSRLQALG